MCLTFSFVRSSNLLRCRLCLLSNNSKRTLIFKEFLNTYKLEKRFVNKYSTTMTSETSDLFKGNIDRFNGVTVDSTVEDCELENFPKKLEDSLRSWMESNKRGIWFKVALEHADWVPILAKNGFNYHHAKSNFVMMCKWLPKNETCNIPQYSHTMVGVGAIVVNDKSQILVVREKYWLVPHWKLPGGYVEPGENLIDAAIREVYEETHIQTEFVSLMNIRHTHHGMFDSSDLYIVINLKPLSTDIKICEREISDCKWINIDEYLNHSHIHELNKFVVTSYLDYQQNNLKIDCRYGIHQVFKKPYTVYYVTKKT